MQLGLEAKVAVVTGASRGIGLAVTQALTGEGVHVVAGARTSSTELDALVSAGSPSSSPSISARPPLRPTSLLQPSPTVGSTSS